MTFGPIPLEQIIYDKLIISAKTMNYTLTHACIRVMNLEKSLEFYTKALGLIEARRLDFPQWQFTLVYITDRNGHFELELTYNYAPDKPYEMGNGFSHFAVYTDDLKGSHALHKDEGYTVTDIKDLGEGQASFYFITDPDGYRTEIIQQM